MDLLEKVKQYLSTTSEEEIKKDLESVSNIGITGPNLLEFSFQLENEISSFSCITLDAFDSKFSIEFEIAGHTPYDQAA